MLPSEEAKALFSIKHRRSKRGVGTIVGATFIMLILLSGFAFYSIILSSINSYNETARLVADAEWVRTQEDLAFNSVLVMSDNTLNVTVTNTGTTVATVLWLGFFNESVTPEAQWYFELAEQLAPDETKSIFPDFPVSPDQQYVIQLVTEAGNTYEYSFTVSSQITCELVSFVSPPTVYQNSNFSLFLIVTNTDPDMDLIQNLTVTLNVSPSSVVTLKDAPDSLTVPLLRSGESAYFTWIYQATETGVATFTISYEQAPEGVFTTAEVTVESAPEGGGSGGAVTISGGDGTVSSNPSASSVVSDTQYVSGDVEDLAQSDLQSMVFQSYYTGSVTDTESFVATNESNVDEVPSLGSSSDFKAQQVGPDGKYDVLTEEQTSDKSTVPLIDAESFEGIFPPPGWSASGRWNNEQNFAYDGKVSADFDGGSWQYGELTTAGVDTREVDAVYVDFWYRDGGCESGEFLLQYYNGFYWVNAADLGETSSEREWLHYQDTITESQFFVSGFRMRWVGFTDNNNDDMNVDLVTISVEADQVNYELNLELQWTNLDYEQTNEWLCIYGGKMDKEALQVDVWDGKNWETLFEDLSTGWNNVSISSYLTSKTLTLRLLAGLESEDTSQSSWEIDASLVHSWTISDQYTADVEFTIPSSILDPNSMLWSAVSYWDVANVDVTVQLYNFTSQSYITTAQYTSSSTPNTPELSSQNIPSGTEHFQDTSGNYQIKITGVKDDSSQFLLNVDWINILLSYDSAGSTIPADSWQTYTIAASSTDGLPAAYTYTSIFVNGTSINLTDASDNSTLSNPAWVKLDENGTYSFNLKSTSPEAEDFRILAVVGTTIGQKTVTQEAP
ncbi:MAG: hypothetical protein NWF04_01005 [Candidatus Bathyarchaeota archaeon]|nr:hypothetical protein [Candidatus Bathyarchaeota archaeon]